MTHKSIGLAVVVGGGLLLAGCGDKLETFSQPTGLFAYVKDKGYEPLKIPRTKWGPGTVVSFDARGNENIVMFNDQCLNLTEPVIGSDQDTPDVRVSPASLNNTTFKHTRDMGADIALEKGISKDIDVSGAFNDNRVREVNVTIGGAWQYTVSDLTLVQRLRTLLASNSECAQLLLRPGNFVVDDALIVGKSSFTFIGEGNTKINLDLGLLSALKLTPNFSTVYNGKSELPVESPSIIGYKLYAVQANLGSAGTTIEVRRVTPSQIATMRTPG
jgi:hypothetical protein